MRNRRVTYPVLLVLLAFLAGAAYLVFSAHEDTVAAAASGSVAAPVAADPLEEGEGEDGWRHHGWAGDEPASAAPEPASSGDSIPARAPDDEDYDPQMWAMRRSFRLDGDAGAGQLPFAPSEHEASLVESDGALDLPAGASCEVRLLPVRTRMFNCLARVVCDGRVLYPNPSQTAGYVPCEVEGGEAVSAHDEGHTALDGDPLIRIDLRGGTVTVEDRGDGVEPFRATLRVGRRRT